MKKICKDFAIQDPSSVLPEPLGVQDKADQMKKAYDISKQMQQSQQGQLPPAGSQTNPQLPQPQAAGAPGMPAEPQVQ
jgi:hypothetical protein